MRSLGKSDSACPTHESGLLSIKLEGDVHLHRQARCFHFRQPMPCRRVAHSYVALLRVDHLSAPQRRRPSLAGVLVHDAHPQLRDGMTHLVGNEQNSSRVRHRHQPLYQRRWTRHGQSHAMDLSRVSCLCECRMHTSTAAAQRSTPTFRKDGKVPS